MDPSKALTEAKTDNLWMDSLKELPETPFESPSFVALSVYHSFGNECIIFFQKFEKIFLKTIPHTSFIN